jgi:hypothetical protein
VTPDPLTCPLTPEAYAALPNLTGSGGVPSAHAVGPHKLTPRQAFLLRVIAEGVARGAAPSLREIMAATGATSTNALWQPIQSLVSKGLLRLHRGKNRNLEIVGLAELLGPVVRGHVVKLLGG